MISTESFDDENDDSIGDMTSTEQSTRMINFLIGHCAAEKSASWPVPGSAAVNSYVVIGYDVGTHINEL